MSSKLFNRYIWLVDTINRYGRITRQELSDLWQRSRYSDGSPLARRTFYAYRGAIADLFGITIECDPATYEYYIASGGEHNDSVTDWMLNSAAMGNIISDAGEIAGKIFVEDVPSARQYLAIIIDAVKEHHPVRFDYLPYTRTRATRDIIVHPYFLKIFRQRWYLTGLSTDGDIIKTYALDRMSDVTVERDTFEEPPGFDAEEFCRDAFGIVFAHGDVKDVQIKVDPRQAKYFRALPLHHSQQEFVHDGFSIFRYRLRLTDDFISELLSYGPRLTVVAPTELRAMITSRLTETLSNYATPEDDPEGALEQE